MSFTALLIQTLEVYRRTGEVDRFGQQDSINPRQHVIGGETLVHTYPCRAYNSTGGLAMNERMVDTFERRYNIYTDIGVDINEDDAVRVIGVDGHEIVGLCKVYNSETKYNSHGPHHVEITVWEQAGPGTAAG